jgi:hypothetical protein
LHLNIIQKNKFYASAVVLHRRLVYLWHLYIYTTKEYFIVHKYRLWLFDEHIIVCLIILGHHPYRLGAMGFTREDSGPLVPAVGPSSRDLRVDHLRVHGAFESRWSFLCFGGSFGAGGSAYTSRLISQSSTS